MLGKISADDILKYFFLLFLENKIRHFMQIVSQEDNLSPKGTIYMKSQILFSKKNIISLSSSAESAPSMVNVKSPFKTTADNILKYSFPFFLFFFFFFLKKIMHVAKAFSNTLIFLLHKMQKLLTFFQQTLSMYLPYFKIVILMSR